MPETDIREPAIVAEDLGVKFLIRYHRSEVTIREAFVRLLDRFGSNGGRDERWRSEFWALQDVNLAIYPGEVLGLIGRNGSGKTTLLKTLAGICGADCGHVTVRGKVGCLLSFGVGFKTNLSGRENIYLNGSILGLSRREIDECYDRIVEFSELGRFIDAPVRTYSAGMRGRLGFSIAINIEPDVLLLDEVLSTGDAGFRAKAGSILDVLRSENKTLVFASHSMAMIREHCTRVAWLEAGRIRLIGSPDEVTGTYTEAMRSESPTAKRPIPDGE